MNRFGIMILGAISVLAAIAGFALFYKQAAAPADRNIEPIKTINAIMTITSPSFQENGSIPKKFTCQGEGINPELRFSGAPEETKSFALIMHDPDAPMPGGFTHWVMWNISPKTSSIVEHSVPSGAVEGKNDAGKNGYIGPCPPSGTHRYFFKLYALYAVLNLPAAADKNSLESEINAHLLAKAELVGLYKQ